MSYSDKASGLSQYLKQKRMEKGITQLEASRYLGHTTSQYISNFERGLCEPSIETAMKLCDVYKVGRRELYGLMVDLYTEELNQKIFAKTRKTKLIRRN